MPGTFISHFTSPHKQITILLSSKIPFETRPSLISFFAASLSATSPGWVSSVNLSRSVQHSSSTGLPGWSKAHLGFGTIEEMEDVITTRAAPAARAASSTLSVPSTAGATRSRCGSRGVSRVQGDATWMTPARHPAAAAAMASASRRSAGQRTRRRLSSPPGRERRWEGSVAG
ncbi:hypothetical protein C4D60_Mb08t29160 [Musa balbisiana]|uniref:Uncharacterized protein n=1 Tax=Musa balbisiana TaxID=52838 RepID=A0A4S8K7C8_MUSBA|nr:hypothetical protein C4D60_Mb08t29160 [Musa balbisiana]